MRGELGNYGTRTELVWLENKIRFGEIICYSEGQILSEMSRGTLDVCFLYYRVFLKQSCELFGSEFTVDILDL